MGEPEEIAAVALFLSSEDSRFINAAVIVADGGWTAY
jgi:NAD(P)-dependent dehydrogenase (short-subunit alcohol dehydrogenase family)